MKNEDKTAKAFSGELWKATMIKNILEDNNIQAFLNNELLGSVAPYLADAGGMANIKVIVNAAQLDDALKLIDEFNSSEPVE
jgi:hypothetical protein